MYKIKITWEDQVKERTYTAYKENKKDAEDLIKLAVKISKGAIKKITISKGEFNIK